jgi:hypothetical protein
MKLLRDDNQVKYVSSEGTEVAGSPHEADCLLGHDVSLHQAWSGLW